MLSQLLTALVLICGSYNIETNFSKQTADNEHMVVVMNNDLIFDAVATKEEKSDLPEVVILNQPEFGTITLNADHSFTFSPIPDVCEETDAFTYLINRPQGIDTVNIKIDILCEPLTVLGGFTPDGDGINDHFTILGIQNFPNNSLAIFNAKGEEIYYMKGYNNNWNGELEDGSIVPEDVYYYVFHDGASYHSGYIKIQHKIG